MRYWTIDREAGNRIECFDTKEEAERAISYYEHCDTYEGIYEPNFYDVEEEECLTEKEAIEMVLRYDVNEGQDAWEMVQDGYCGDIDAYIQDYKDDYTVEESDGVVIVSRIGYPNDEPKWFIENGTVCRK